MDCQQLADALEELLHSHEAALGTQLPYVTTVPFGPSELPRGFTVRFSDGTAFEVLVMPESGNQ